MHQNVKQIINQIYALPAFPLARWSCSDDASGTAITLARQRRWIVDQLKEQFGQKPPENVPVNPDPEDLREALARIVRAVEQVDCREDWIPALQDAKRLLNGDDAPKVSVSEEVDGGVFDDINQSARYYCSRAFGTDRDSIVKELTRRFEEDDSIDPLTALFTQHREKYLKIAPSGLVQVPLEPTTEMWDDLARAIVGWAGETRSRTPRSLFYTLKTTGIAIPQWLKDEPDMQDLDHAVNKGTRAVIIYKAMVQGYLNSKLQTPVIDTALRQALLTSAHLVELIKPASASCMCLTELEHDAYMSGGPSSGHPLPPPCKLHPGG